MPSEAPLLADAEAGEDLTQQRIGVEAAGDLGEGFLGEAKVFGDQFGAGVGGEGIAGLLQLSVDPAEGVDVAGASAEAAFAGVLADQVVDEFVEALLQRGADGEFRAEG